MPAAASAAAEHKRKLETLLELRETRPESEAKRLAASLQELQACSDTLIQSQRAEIESLREAAAAAAASAPELAAASGGGAEAERLAAENAQLRAQLEALEHTTAIYMTLTGVTVRLEAGGQTATCECRGEERTHAFTVDTQPEDGDEGEIGYAPAPGAVGCPGLPDYLLDELIFEREQAPALLVKVMEAVGGGKAPHTPRSSRRSSIMSNA